MNILPVTYILFSQIITNRISATLDSNQPEYKIVFIVAAQELMTSTSLVKLLLLTAMHGYGRL